MAGKTSHKWETLLLEKRPINETILEQNGKARGDSFLKIPDPFYAPIRSAFFLAFHQAMFQLLTMFMVCSLGTKAGRYFQS